MKNLINNLTDDTPMSVRMQKALSLVFLIISVSMAFISYDRDGIFFSTKLEIFPGFISTLVAIILIAPLYARNILKWNKSFYTLISLILFLLLFGSLVELAMGGNGLNSQVVQYLLLSAIILSWLGMKSIAGASWLLLFPAIAVSIIENNTAMGFYGFIYVASGFIGILLHSELNPANLVKGIKEEFSNSEDVQNAIKSDINQTVNTIKSIIND